MKTKLAIFILVAIFTTGCGKSLDRLLGHDEDRPQYVPSISSVPDISATAPDFGIEIPAGYSRVVFHGKLPMTGLVTVTANPGAKVQVFMKQLDIFDTYFYLGTVDIGAFYYEFDPNTGRVVYHGIHLENIEYCVYEYLPLP